MRIYLSGPMSNRPRNNFDVFEAAAQSLRKRGYDVVSPHELDDEAERAAAWASPDGKTDPGTWARCLARDIEIIASPEHGIEAIVVLHGWGQSAGALLETYLGYRLLGLPVYYYGPRDPLVPLAPATLDKTHLKEAA